MESNTNEMSSRVLQSLNVALNAGTLYPRHTAAASPISTSQLVSNNPARYGDNIKHPIMCNRSLNHNGCEYLRYS
eukprot:9853470-Karenia_brevis.AAC.1